MAKSPGPAPLVTLARAHVASLAGDAFLTVSLAGSLFFTVPTAAARGRVMLYLVLTMAPFAVIAPIVGPALDRLPTSRKLAMAATAAGRAVVVLFMARDLQGLSLYPEAFVALVLAKSYAIIKNAILPTTVLESAELVDANSRLARLGLVGGAAAGLLASGVLKLFGADWCLRAGAVVYAAGTVMAFRVRSRRDDDQVRGAVASPVFDGEALGLFGGATAATTETTPGATGRVAGDAVTTGDAVAPGGAAAGGVGDAVATGGAPAGTRDTATTGKVTARRVPGWLRWWSGAPSLPPWWPLPLDLPITVSVSATAMGMLRAAVGFVTFLFAFALKGRGEPTWFFGVVLAASLVSNFVGAAVAPIARKVASEEWILGGCLLASAVVGGLAAWREGRLSILGVAVTLGVAAAAARLAFDSLVQRDAPARMRGRTFARLETRFQLTWAIGALIPTALRLKLPAGLTVLAIGLALAGVSYLSALRGHRAAARRLAA